MWDHTLTELFFRGGEVMWPLLLCSLLAVAVILERVAVFLFHAASFEALKSSLQGPVSAGHFQEAQQIAASRRGLIAKVAAAYLANVHRSTETRDDVVSRTAAEQMARLERRLNWLAMLGQLAPMLGLLGTVTGLIAAFHQIELNQGQVQPEDLASGIWEALLTTVFGLVIALPVLAIYGLLEHRVARVGLKMQLMCSYLNDWCDAARAGGTAGVPETPAIEPPAKSKKEHPREPVGAGR